MSVSLTLALWAAFRAAVKAGKKNELPPPPHRLVLLALADRADGDGKAWPSVETISGDTGQGLTTVESCLVELEVAKWITGERRKSGGRPMTTVYEVHLDGSAITRRRAGRHTSHADTTPGTVSGEVIPRRAGSQHHAGRGINHAAVGPVVASDTPPIFGDTPPGEGSDTPPMGEVIPRRAGMILSGSEILSDSEEDQRSFCTTAAQSCVAVGLSCDSSSRVESEPTAPIAPPSSPLEPAAPELDRPASALECPSTTIAAVAVAQAPPRAIPVAASSPADTRTLQLFPDVAAAPSTTIAAAAPSPKGKPRKTKAPDAPPGDHQAVMAAYSVAYSVARGVKPILGGAEGKAANVLLGKTRGLERALEAIGGAFADPWFKNNDGELTSIANKPNKYLGQKTPTSFSGQSGGARGNTLQPAAPPGAPSWSVGEEM